jgi:RHS repeat-associated protein
MSPITMLARAVPAMLLLFACAGAHAQGATASAGLHAAAAPALVANDAMFVSQSVPASMTPGGAYNVSVTMKNTGSATWPAGSAYKLGSQNPLDNTYWGIQRATLGAPVSPGGQATFSFQVKAPATVGTYGFQWRMVQEYVTWFGALTPNVAVTVAAPQPRNDAQVIGQSAPSQMASGKSYTVSVTLKNTGTTTWKSADSYILGAQNPQDSSLWNSGRVTLGATVAPGQQYTFNFPVTAPAPGSYNMQWKMVREYVEWFGGTSSSPVTVAGAPGSDVVTYIHTDALGSPVARSDASGNVVSRTRYEPYGGTASGVTPTIGFTGHVNDADTGLVYMQQRYYDPVAGRFMSIDPVTTDANTGGSFNRYVYGKNSPYKYIDPDGRAPLIIVPAVVIARTAIVAATAVVIVKGKEMAKGASSALSKVGNAIANAISNATTTTTPTSTSPAIDPKDVGGKTPAEIDKIAGELGLQPKGPDPKGGRGAYVDPVTGEQRILVHPGAKGGGHSHVNNPQGERLDMGGNVVAPESAGAHLPLNN